MDRPQGSQAPSGTAGGSDLGFLNANHVRHEPSAGLTGMFSGMFAAVKEYFWPASLPTLAHANHALADRAIAVDVESTGGFNPDPDADQSSRYSHAFTIKRVALVAAAAGIAAAAYLVHSALYAHGGGDAG